MAARHDTLFVCAASFEARCLAGPLSLRNDDYHTDAAIVFYYEHPDLMELRDDRLNRLSAILDDVSGKHLQVIPCDLYEPQAGMRAMSASEYFHKLTHSGGTCTMDTSTLTKKHLLMLMRFLDVSGNPPSRLLYTKTANPIYSKLTEGILSVDAIPGFAGSVSAHRPTRLILFLGFEAERAMAVWRYYEPASAVAVLSDVPSTPQWLLRMKEIHRELLQIPTVDSVVVQAGVPSVTWELLRDEIKLRSESHDICIAPLGSKAQVIGVYEAARECPEVQVAYCPPHRYLPNYPRRGVGETVFFSKAKAGEGLHYIRDGVARVSVEESSEAQGTDSGKTDAM